MRHEKTKSYAKSLQQFLVQWRSEYCDIFVPAMNCCKIIIIILSLKNFCVKFSKKATDSVVMASYMKNIWGTLKTEQRPVLPTQELYERENFYLLSKISFWSSSWLSWLQQATRFLKLRKRWQVCHTLLTKWSTNQALKKLRQDFHLWAVSQ